MIIQLVKSLLWLLTCILITACASTSTMTDSERTIAYDQYIETNKLESIKRITSFNFYSWSSLGDEHLIISSRMNKPNLIRLQRNCFDLSFANGIMIHSSGSVLSAKFDAISVLERNSIKCFIKSIYPLSKDQAKELAKIGYLDKDSNEEQIVESPKS